MEVIIAQLSWVNNIARDCRSEICELMNILKFLGLKLRKYKMLYAYLNNQF
jgi:hypothetical protein